MSRVSNSIANAKTNLVFYFINLVVAFVSRRIFLDKLGSEFLGYLASIQNILGFLNLAELGVATAIGYVLYKPLAESDREKINKVVSVLGFLYFRIGLFILFAGIALMPFLPHLLKPESLSLKVIFFGYVVFLGIACNTYFFTYHLIVLVADQKDYIQARLAKGLFFLQQIALVFLVFYTRNLYLYFCIYILFSIANCVLLRGKIHRFYPWLSVSIQDGKKSFAEFPEIKRYVRQCFIHKISEFVQYQTIPLLIAAFVSLKSVTHYENYAMLGGKVSILFNVLLTSTAASIGNLVVSNIQEKIQKTYGEMFSLCFFAACFVAFSIYVLSSKFISLWLGKAYILPKLVLLLIVVDIFLSLLRRATDQFLYAYGLFYDVWAPGVEALIYLLLAIGLGKFYGLPGILVGGIASKIIIVHIWKPYFLYSRGFQVPSIKYVLLLLRHIVVYAPVMIVLYLCLINCSILQNIRTWWQWFSLASSLCLVFIVMVSMLGYLFLSEYRSVMLRFGGLLRKHLSFVSSH